MDQLSVTAFLKQELAHVSIILVKKQCVCVESTPRTTMAGKATNAPLHSC